MSKAATDAPATRKCAKCQQAHVHGSAHACFSGSLYPTILKADNKAPQKQEQESDDTSNGIKACPACGKKYKKSHTCKQHCQAVEGLTGIVYLVQPSALWVAKSNIFKIGCSKQLTLSRPKSYGPNPAPHALASVDDASKVERALIAAFDAEFKCESAVGREYYSGSILDMKRTFNRVVNECLTVIPAPAPALMPTAGQQPPPEQKGGEQGAVSVTTAKHTGTRGKEQAAATEEQLQPEDGGFVDWLFVELSSLFAAKMKLEKK